MSMRPRLVELVGAAGAGKSTLLHCLSEHPHRIQIVPPKFKPWQAPFWLTAGMAEQRLLRHLVHDIRVEGKADLRRCVRLRALIPLSQTLCRWRRSREALVFDEGPLYLLARLRRFSGLAADPIFSDYLDRMLRHWAEALDLVVLLDAPNAALATRIRMRDKNHRVKFAGDADVFQFLDTYRAEYESLLLEAGLLNTPRVVRIDTGADGPNAIAAQLLLAVRKRMS